MTQAFNLSQLANKVNSSGQLDVATGVTGTQAVANGGTGQSTYTNGQLLIGNSTGNTLTKTTLTAGTGISITNGAGSITVANTLSSGFVNMQVFTSPGTFTTPATTTRIKVTVIGGGGGGTKQNPAPIGGNPGFGGGSGGASIYVGPISASTPYPVTIGTGSQTTGGTSSFGSICSATGGGYAPGGPELNRGGIGSGGTLNLRGGPGAGSTGGLSILGGGKIPGSNNGGEYGGGGSGQPNSPAVSSSFGGDGVVVVEF